MGSRDWVGFPTSDVHHARAALQRSVTTTTVTNGAHDSFSEILGPPFSSLWGRGWKSEWNAETYPYALIADVLPTPNDMDRRSIRGREEMIQARYLATTRHKGTEEPLTCQDLSQSANDLVVAVPGLCSYFDITQSQWYRSHEGRG